MSVERTRLSPVDLTRAVIVGGYLFMLAANLPGHLSVDSILTLYEGRFHERVSWNPPFHAWLLGVFDHVLTGTGLYVVVTSLMLFGGWMWLLKLAGRATWLSAIVALLAALTPNILIYQGIVWKDVFFANSAIFGFVLLTAASVRGGRQLVHLAVAALVFAAASQVRQNGLVIWIPAAAAVAWSLREMGWRRMLSWSLGWLVAVAVIAKLLAMFAVAEPIKPGADSVSQGIRIVQQYDIAGALHFDPTLPLPEIDKANPSADDALRARAGLVYSPQRVDTLDADPALGDVFGSIPDEAVHAEWLRLITHHPGLYLQTRFADFRWVFATPVIDRCLPIYLGVDGPPKHMERLRLELRHNMNEQRLFNYTTWFLDTPVISHVTWAIAALLTAVALLWRRRAADVPVAAMLIAALGFTASFLIVSIACDYRYLYFLDAAALTGLVYLSFDPVFWRKRSPA